VTRTTTDAARWAVELTRRVASFALLALAVQAPRVASACAVCSAGREDETRLAFLLTTILLSVLPPLAVGVTVWWIVRRARSLQSPRPPAPQASIALER
jgi:hypothetical protein